MHTEAHSGCVLSFVFVVTNFEEIQLKIFLNLSNLNILTFRIILIAH